MTASATLVEGRGLAKTFEGRTGLLGSAEAPTHAVAGVDIEVREGEIVGLVGESGSGKSTLGRLLVRLLEPDAGTIRFEGDDLLALRGEALRRRRRGFQFVFQDPLAALNPRMRVGSLVREPLEVHRIGADRRDRDERVATLLREVGLDRHAMERYPSEFSGGQRQRIGIARAIACEPRFLVADEPVSALDPPIQAQIVNLLLDLRDRRGLSILFVSHDLRLVGHLCDRISVMHRGRIVEEGPARRICQTPEHPYTRALLASAPAAVPPSRP